METMLRIWELELTKRFRIARNLHLVWKYYISTFNYKLALSYTKARWIDETSISADGGITNSGEMTAVDDGDMNTRCNETRSRSIQRTSNRKYSGKRRTESLVEDFRRDNTKQGDNRIRYRKMFWLYRLKFHMKEEDLGVPRNLTDMIMGTIVVAGDQLPQAMWIEEENRTITSKKQARLQAERPYKGKLEHWKDWFMEEIRDVARKEQAKVEQERINIIAARNIIANWEDFGGISIERRDRERGLEMNIPIDQMAEMPYSMSIKEREKWPFIISTKRAKLEDMKGWKEPEDKTMNHAKTMMAYGYNGGGAYIGKRWVPMRDEYLWYKLFRSAQLYKHIKHDKSLVSSDGIKTNESKRCFGNIELEGSGRNTEGIFGDREGWNKKIKAQRKIQHVRTRILRRMTRSWNGDSDRSS